MGATFTADQFEPERLGASIGGHEVAIAVLPKLGANLISFVVDGHELLYWDENDLSGGDYPCGCFHMFPTPCRLPDAKYVFEDKEYTQTKGGEKVAIHGLLRDEPMQVSASDHALTATLHVKPDSPVHEGYPFPSTFALEYRLIPAGIEIHFCFANEGDGDAPFGYGLHPFWKLSPSRADTAVRIPCAYRMELDNLIPTGVITPIEKGLDLRQTTVLEGVDIDNVFWERDVSVPAVIEYRDIGKKLVLEASDVFNHMIAYTPSGKPFGCVEFLTCAPNQINLHNAVAGQGDKDVSGLIVVPPGGVVTGWVRYTLQDL